MASVSIRLFPVLLIVMTGVAISPSSAAGGERYVGGGGQARVYYDYAEVVAVRELFQSATAGTGRPACRAQDHPLDLAMGTPRADGTSTSIASAMLRELEASHACDTQALTRRRSAGFEVTYRYGGRLYRRVMSEPPGERMRVRVELAAGRP